MRKIVLAILLLAVVVYFFSNKYIIKSGRSTDGKYSLVLVDKNDGSVKQLIGGK
ncbi:MAG: hypothetical protein WC683_08330 [bacterium]